MPIGTGCWVLPLLFGRRQWAGGGLVVGRVGGGVGVGCKAGTLWKSSNLSINRNAISNHQSSKSSRIIQGGRQFCLHMYALLCFCTRRSLLHLLHFYGFMGTSYLDHSKRTAQMTRARMWNRGNRTSHPPSSPSIQLTSSLPNSEGKYAWHVCMPPIPPLPATCHMLL